MTEIPSNGAVVHPNPTEPGKVVLVFFFTVRPGQKYQLEVSNDAVTYKPAYVLDFSSMPPMPPEVKFQVTHTVSDTVNGPWPRLQQL